ncbi:hypothetical protein [Pseudomonas oryzihabitans]|uniref:hypothetical protein n=1 Tax=Pseudomonas oryzihabitans TaxID=47885 RepID=UPI0030C26382
MNKDKTVKLRFITPKNIINTLILAISIASAHYIGFLMHIPFEMLSLIADNFLIDFIFTFIFYVTLSLTMSRVIAFSLSQLISSETSALAAFSLWLRRHWPNKFNKFGIKAFKENAKIEAASYWLFLITAFIFILNFSYSKISLDKVGNFSWLVIVGMSISIISKAGFLNRNPLEASKRIFDKKRVRLHNQLIQIVVKSGTGLLLVSSFYSGIFRYEKVIDETPLDFQSSNYNGKANILLSSGQKFLLIEKADPKRFVYTDNQKIITYRKEK